jgi:nickel-dependent lactate racemase
MIGAGYTDRALVQSEAQRIVEQAVEAMAVAGKKVLAIVPDATRTCPLPLLSRMLHQQVAARGGSVDFLIALGTHPEMTTPQIEKLFAVPAGAWQKEFGASRVFNHQWKNPDALQHIGKITAEEVAQISGGLFRMDVNVAVNKLVLQYDRVLVLGPVFPHEVAGFSGGNKYFFPGVCGEELLNFFHWLGAVITNPRIIGTKHTPVRATVDRAAAMLKMDKFALCMVVGKDGLNGLYFDTPEKAWSAAADLSNQVHILYVDKPFDSILAKAPAMYDDIWTAGKCMYKMESVVADGGELIIYAPHVTEVSYTHGAIIDQVGYHTRDYFLAQWEKFKHFPWGVLAHSTHVRGIGTFEDGVEKCRVRVTLATGIPESRCRKINLGYRDPATIDPADWQDKPGRLFVPKAGEMLYRLSNPPAWQTFQA